MLVIFLILTICLHGRNQPERYCSYDLQFFMNSVNIKTPLEMQDKQMVETYYKDGNALYMVSVEDG